MKEKAMEFIRTVAASLTVAVLVHAAGSLSAISDKLGDHETRITVLEKQRG